MILQLRQSHNPTFRECQCLAENDLINTVRAFRDFLTSGVDH